jgi:hypothetical protein
MRWICPCIFVPVATLDGELQTFQQCRLNWRLAPALKTWNSAFHLPFAQYTHPTLNLSRSPHSIKSTRMTFEGKKLFKYDAPTPFKCRLFLLELNEEHDPLTGRLMSFKFDQAYTDVASIVKQLPHILNDKNRVMEAVSQDQYYTALSYSWGQSAERYPLRLSTISCELDRSLRKKWDNDDSKMILQDHEPDRNGYLMIGTNLRDYLLEYRRRRLAQFLWIDAICIDQSNTTDKNNQIPLMRHIYSAAQKVHVWLGDASPLEHGALRIMPAVIKKLQGNGDAGENFNLTTDEMMEQRGLPPVHHEVWTALASILSRS